MGKKLKTDFYKVHSIAGMKTDEVTGELRFLVKWSGFSKAYDTWEPLHNLRNVQDMLRNYLIKHGYQPDSVLTGNFPSPIVSSLSSNSDSDTEFVPYPVSTPRKHEKKSKSSRPPSPPAIPTKEQSPVIKTEKVTEAKTDPFQMLTDFMTPIQTKPQSIETNGKRYSCATKSVLAGVKPRPGNLNFDRPVKIVGVRRGEKGLEYSVLFKSNEREMVGMSTQRHEDIIQKAPWLFSQFFMATSSLTMQ